MAKYILSLFLIGISNIAIPNTIGPAINYLLFDDSVYVPVNRPPTATNRTLFIQQYSFGDVELSTMFSDPDGDDLSFQIIDDGGAGDARILYGIETILQVTQFHPAICPGCSDPPFLVVVRANDGNGGQSDATLTVRVL